jgi:hypothetical protein
MVLVRLVSLVTNDRYLSPPPFLIIITTRMLPRYDWILNDMMILRPRRAMFENLKF